ncbi:MAG: hypothetical protein QW818_00195 [Candidatus Aenigmatarchaeota archaeon]
MKAVSLIVQFVIFFTIGLSFFLLVGNLFKFQSDLIKRDILESGSTLSLNQLSAALINAVNSCKSCNNVSIKIDQKPIAEYTQIYQLSDNLILKIEPENKIIKSSLHNLNYSINSDPTEFSASKTITLTYDRTNNKLVIK